MSINTFTAIIKQNNHKKMILIDTHTHLTHMKTDEQKSALQNAKEKEIEKMITVTCELSDFEKCLSLANSHENIWTTAGIHPTAISKAEDLETVYETAKKNEKVIAIGEIGLDYYHDRFPHNLQKEFFRKQLEIAQNLNLPAIIHCRGGKNPGENEEAFIDTIQILEEERFSNAVMHCFSGNKVEAEKIIDMGLMISFTDIISRKGNEELHEIIQIMPLNRMMLETDSPYISKEPAGVVRVAKKIAEIKGVDLNEVIRITTENAEQFFGI